MSIQLKISFEEDKLVEDIQKNSLLLWCKNNNRTQLLDEWDYDKNGDISPKDISYGSEKRVWWRCSRGHSWDTMIYNRTHGKTNCPYCSSKKVYPGYNDLATMYPSLANEWNYDKNELTPEQYMSKSNKKVWWVCRYGHEYQAKIVSRTTENTGCPICNKERKTSFQEKAVYYYIKSCFPEAQDNVRLDWLGNYEIDIYIPSLNIGVEYDGCFWHENVENDIKKDDLCQNNGVNLIRIRGFGCPRYDSSSSKIYCKKDTYEELCIAIEQLFDIIKTKHGIALSCDIDVSRDYSKILDIYVSKQKENNLAKKRPDLASQWDYSKNGKVKPELVSVSSNKRVWWICPKCNHSYDMKIVDRTGAKHSNCPYCSSKRIEQGVNDLGTLYPDLLKEWDFDKNTISPYEIPPGTHKKVWWKCEKNHSWKTNVYVRSIMGNGCPFCAHLVADVDNSFAALYPNLLEEWDYSRNSVDPRTVLPKSNKKYWWKCKKCNHEWESTMSHRTEGKGCPVCANRVVVKGINDLESQFPEIAKEWNWEKNNKKPSEISKFSNQKCWWKCKVCGHEWESVVSSRTGRNTKCPSCRYKLY